MVKLRFLIMGILVVGMAPLSVNASTPSDEIDSSFVAAAMSVLDKSPNRKALFGPPLNSLVPFGKVYCQLRQEGKSKEDAMKWQVIHSDRNDWAPKQRELVIDLVVAAAFTSPKYYCPEFQD